MAERGRQDGDVAAAFAAEGLLYATSIGWARTGPRFAAVVLEGFEEELGVGFDLEEAAVDAGSAGEEVGAGYWMRRGMAIGIGQPHLRR